MSQDFFVIRCYLSLQTGRQQIHSYFKYNYNTLVYPLFLIVIKDRNMIEVTDNPSVDLLQWHTKRHLFCLLC